MHVLLRAVALPAVLLAACGPWQQVGSESAPDPSSVVPRLFDTRSLYQGMGLLAAGQPVPFVAAVRFLAGPSSDSTLALVGVSLANNALSFRRATDVFEARYRVDVTFRVAGRFVAQFSRDEAVRVASFQETQRSDESVVFQGSALVPPESLTATVALYDLSSGTFSRAEADFTVPRLGDPGSVSPLVAVHRATPRADRRAVPDLLMNPRATVPYGQDTLRFYLEAYALPRPETLVVRGALRQGETEIWRDTVVLGPDSLVAAAMITLPPESLAVGELSFEVISPSTPPATRAYALVSFSDQWVVVNLDETLSLLRYFGHEAELDALRQAPIERRSALWHAFWSETDPDPLTPENEALDEYFHRVQVANDRFREQGLPGWLTDRGEVFITLGAPDEVYEAEGDLQGRQRVIRWSYVSHRVTLDFVDETGFGRFRLTPGSRQDFLVARNRLRRNA